MNRTYSRRYDLDWLRVLAFTLLILFHTGMMFNGWNWHVKNPETSHTLEYVMIFLSQWRMPLLFFISGAAVWFAMEKYSAGRFAWERVKRLALPLLFGMLVIIPPQVYYERLFQGQEFESFWSFYETVFDLQPYPTGNFSWHHLWYLPYILLYSLLMLPFFRYFKNPKGHLVLKRWIDRLASGRLTMLGFLPIAVSEICLRPFWPDNASNLVEDWAQFVSMLVIFSWGFGFASSQKIWPALELHRRTFLGTAMFTTGCLYIVWYGGIEFPESSISIYRLIRSANLWFWILVILSFGSKYLRFSNSFLRYANHAVYPFYMLHQTVTVVVGYYLVDWSAGVPVKFCVLALATFLGSWVLYEFPIKRFRLLRPLFGLKLNIVQGKETILSSQRVIYSSGRL